MAKQITIDPNGAALDLVDRASGIDVVGLGWPAPTDEDVWAEGAMTEGARLAQSRPQNVERRVEVRCFGPDGRTRLRELLQKVGKLRREGGEVALTLQDDSTATWRVETARIDGPSDEQWFVHHFRDSIVVPVVFVCRPYGRGVESQAAQVTETSLPVVTASFDAPAGDVPAEARFVIDDLQGADQGFVAWGVQSRYVSSANTAQLFYQAEELTPLGGATVTNVSGASGGQVVRQGTLTPVWAAMLSFRHATHGPLTHVGDFNVWVRTRRPATNSGEMSVALEWGVGDMTRVTRNDPIVFAADAYEDLFMWLNLGQVHVPEDASQWDGRIIARSTVAGDDLDVDCVWFQPIAEGAGEIAAEADVVAPSTFAARDEFNQSAGPLHGATMPVGATWVTEGATGDFQLTGTGEVIRTTTAEGGNRYAVANGTSALTDTFVQVDFKVSAFTPFQRSGVVARYAATNKWIWARVTDLSSSGDGTLEVGYWTGSGSMVILGTAAVRLAINTYVTIALLVTASGQYRAWLAPKGADPGQPKVSGYLSELATGGALAAGKAGIVDTNGSALAVTRTYDNFVAWAARLDGAIFANRSLEVRHDGAEREDSTGTIWTPITVEGDYATVPPAGREQRDARVTVLTSRGPRVAPGVVLDPAIDDKRLTVHTTPRYLLIP